MGAVDNTNHPQSHLVTQQTHTQSDQSANDGDDHYSHPPLHFCTSCFNISAPSLQTQCRPTLRPEGDGHVTEKEVFLGESYLGLYYFRALDMNGDEAITRAELRSALEQEGYEEDVVERRATEDFDWADLDGDNEWDMGEYLRWYTWDSSEEEIGEDFRAVDKDGNGLISQEELGRSYEAMGVIEFRTLAKVLIRELDNNGDNFINFVEWSGWY